MLGGTSFPSPIKFFDTFLNVLFHRLLSCFSVSAVVIGKILVFLLDLSLIRLKSGELSYITKRFDRTDLDEKKHMIDMFQILEAFDKYKSSMEKVGKAIGQYSNRSAFDKLYYFELTVFSFLTGNNDMHLKNFSLL
ncbi:MAG: HipA domain-containing protein, partial [Flavobacterium sp.]